MDPFEVFTWILVGGSFIGFTLGLYTWSRRAVPGAVPFLVMIGGGIVSAVGYIIQLNSHTLVQSVFWSNVQYVGFAIMPVAVLILALQYSSHHVCLSRRRLTLLFLIPVLTILIAWTDGFHGLFRQHLFLAGHGIHSLLGKTAGPWFWVHISYTYLAILAAYGFFIYHYRYASVRSRKQIKTLLLGITIVVAGNIYHLSQKKPQPELDLTVLLYTPASLVMACGLFCHRMFDVTPVAYNSIFESMHDGMIILDENNLVVEINPPARALLCLSTKFVIGTPIASAAASWPALRDCLRGSPQSPTEITRIQINDQRCYDIRISPIKGDPEGNSGKIILIRDITDQKIIEKELRQLSVTDPLTGINNRRIFFENLCNEIRTAIQTSDPLSIILLDVDNFKELNDSLGHQAGDDALVDLVCIINQSLRKTDVVARYGGDEFVIILPHTQLENARQIAERLVALIRRLYVDHVMRLSTSIGVAVLQSGDDPDGHSLLARADKALMKAKQAGKGIVTT